MEISKKGNITGGFSWTDLSSHLNSAVFVLVLVLVFK
jgi:hypothetical protein